MKIEMIRPEGFKLDEIQNLVNEFCYGKEVVNIQYVHIMASNKPHLFVITYKS